MNLIKSDIINAEYDPFWEDISAKISGAAPKTVLIIVNSYEKDSEDETQLAKMITACALHTEQYNIVQLADGEKIAWHQLRDVLNPKIIFLVGIYPVQLGISSMFCLNSANNFNDRIWLPTLSIRELENHKDIKKQLWLEGINPVFINKKYGHL